VGGLGAFAVAAEEGVVGAAHSSGTDLVVRQRPCRHLIWRCLEEGAMEALPTGAAEGSQQSPIAPRGPLQPGRSTCRIWATRYCACAAVRWRSQSVLD